MLRTIEPLIGLSFLIYSRFEQSLTWLVLIPTVIPAAVMLLASIVIIHLFRLSREWSLIPVLMTTLWFAFLYLLFTFADISIDTRTAYVRSAVAYLGLALAFYFWMRSISFKRADLRRAAR